MPWDDQRRAWLLWAALVASSLMYAAVALLLPLPELRPTALPTAVLMLAAAGLGAASFAARALLVVRPVRARRLDSIRPEGAQRILSASVLGWALAETVGLLGLGAALLTGDQAAALKLVATSFVLLAVQSPRRSALRPPQTSEDLARRPDPIG